MIGEITALGWLHIPALAARRNSVGENQPGEQEPHCLTSHQDVKMSPPRYPGPPGSPQPAEELSEAGVHLVR